MFIQIVLAPSRMIVDVQRYVVYVIASHLPPGGLSPRPNVTWKLSFGVKIYLGRDPEILMIC